MDNTLSSAELKRHGIAAIEQGLKHGPVYLIKRNKTAAVVLSAKEYEKLVGGQPTVGTGMSAIQWLLNQSSSATRDKQEIDTALAEERNW